jgi:hypothetical protein
MSKIFCDKFLITVFFRKNRYITLWRLYKLTFTELHSNMNLSDAIIQLTEQRCSVVHDQMLLPLTLEEIVWVIAKGSYYLHVMFIYCLWTTLLFKISRIVNYLAHSRRIINVNGSQNSLHCYVKFQVSLIHKIPRYKGFICAYLFHTADVS